MDTSDSHRLDFDIHSLLAEEGWLRGLVARLVRADAVDDVMQETLQAAWQHPPAQRGALRPWLARVARNFAARWHRSETRRRRHETVAEADREAIGTAELVSRVEAQGEIAGLVLALPEPYRDTLLRRYFEGLTTPELARRQGVAEATVRSRVQRGLQRLREALQRRHGDAGAAGLCGAVLGVPLTPDALAVPTGWAASKAALASTLLFTAMPKILTPILLLLLIPVLWYLLADPAPPARPSGQAETSSTRVLQVDRQRRDIQQNGPDVAAATPGASARVLLPRQPAAGLLVQVLDPQGRPLPEVAIHKRHGRGFSVHAGPGTTASSAASAAGRVPARPEPGLRHGPLLGTSDARGQLRIAADLPLHELRCGPGHCLLFYAAGEGEHPIRLIAAESVVLRGRVFDERGAPLPRVHVQPFVAELASWPEPLDRFEKVYPPGTRGDQEGGFALAQVPVLPGMQLHFDKPGFAALCLHLHGDHGAFHEVRMRRAPDDWLVLRGRVLDAARQPVAGAALRCGDQQTRSAADGRFRFRVLATAVDANQYRVLAHKPGLGAAMLPYTRARLLAPRHLELVLKPADQRLHGILRDASGRPLAGAQVFVASLTRESLYGPSLEQLAGGGTASHPELGLATRCDAAGAFSFAGLLDRGYDLRVIHPDRFQHHRFAGLRPGHAVHQLELPAESLRAAQACLLVSPQGQPLAGQKVLLRSVTERVAGARRILDGPELESDASGRLLLPSCSNAFVELYISGPEIIPRAVELRAHGGEVERLTLQRRCHFRLRSGVTLPPGGITLEFFDGAGKGLRIYEFSPGGFTSQTRKYFRRYASQPFAVAESARQVRIYAAPSAEVFRQIAVKPRPGEVQELQF